MAEAATNSADYVLAVSNENGMVTAMTSFPSAQVKATASAAAFAAATDPACNETAVAYLGFKWNTTVKWYFNQSTATSRAGLNGQASLAAIRAGNSNITAGANNCGFPTGQFSAHGAYQATTSKFANIGTDAECTSNFPDGQSAVSFGPFDDTGTLSLTCTEWDDQSGTEIAFETDTYYGSNVGLVTSCPATSTDKFDLETNATHEWGHSYGLDHVSAPTG